MSKPARENPLTSAFQLGPETDRRTAILAAALDVFMRYGFSRTTMDDIAHAAGLSRPLLYREFRNKADIYAAIAETLFARSLQDARQALAGDAPLAERLNGAMEAGVLDMVVAISQSPHGAEILELKGDMTQDVLSDWVVGMIDSIADAIAREAKGRDIDLDARGLTARGLAESLVDGLEGAKLRSDDPAIWREATRRLVLLVDLAIR